MTTEVVQSWNAQTAERLFEVFQEAMERVKDEGFRPHEVLANKRRLTLVRETLSDGSCTLNLDFSEGDAFGTPRIFRKA